MKIIRKKHITPEQLAMFTSLSEKDVAGIPATVAKISTSPGEGGVNHAENEKEINENTKKAFSWDYCITDFNSDAVCTSAWNISATVSIYAEESVSGNSSGATDDSATGSTTNDSSVGNALNPSGKSDSGTRDISNNGTALLKIQPEQ